MEKLKCGWCGKVVRNKPLLGTMHVCLSAPERMLIEAGRAQAMAQANAKPYAWDWIEVFPYRKRFRVPYRRRKI